MSDPEKPESELSDDNIIEEMISVNMEGRTFFFSAFLFAVILLVVVYFYTTYC